MRDIGFDFYWTDVHAQDLLARGFEYDPSIGQIDLLTCFETFEHLVNPLPEIEKMLHISREILLLTILLPSPLPSTGKWNYFGLSHGQHVSFYTKHTLEFIARRYGLNFYTDGESIHLFTSKTFRKNLLTKLSAASSGKRFERIRRRMKSRTSEDSLMMAELRSREAGETGTHH